jgi:cysteine desulfurase/selenocysteine lyase
VSAKKLAEERGKISRLDPYEVREDFPILGRRVHSKPLVYLDNAASTQKPRAVVDAVARYYVAHYSNVHRGLHKLSSE